MVSSVARFNLVHYRIQSPLRPPIYLSALEEVLHHCAMAVEQFGPHDTSHDPVNPGLDYSRVTDIEPSTDTGRHQASHGALGAIQTLALLCRFALWTVIYRVRLPGSIV